MPAYSFECKQCRKAFEVTATVAEYTARRREKQIACPVCGATGVIRVFSVPGIVAGGADRPGGGCRCPGGNCQ